MAIPVTQLVAATYDAVVNEKGKAADQWSDSSAMAHLEKIGGIKRVDGGPKFTPTLDYKSNPGLDFLATDTTATSTTKTEVLTHAEYTPIPVVVPINVSFYDEAINSGKNQKVDLVSSIVDNMITSHDQGFENALFATTGGTDGFNTFVDIFTEDGTGTVGTIVAGTETWWKNQFLDWGTATGATLLGHYNTLYFACSKGSAGRQPNVILSSALLFGNFLAANQANQRFLESTGTTLKYVKMQNADYIFSSAVSGSTEDAFMFNTKDTQVWVVKGAWRQRREAVDFVNAAMWNVKTFSVAQLLTMNRSRGGRLWS
jgi:hypothetical protein